MTFSLQGITLGLRQPGDLGALWEAFHGFSKEARARGIALSALAGFALIAAVSLRVWEAQSILGCT
jgi:hypothetical protein